MNTDHTQNQHSKPERSIVLIWGYAGLALLVIILFLGAPAGGNFYWSDAPRHALNGVFVKDLFVAMPWNDPIGFAYQYYAQYPALTILFYPPLFYFIAAPFYGLLGVSHETALFVVMLHYIAFGWGVWRLFQFWLPSRNAMAATIVLLVAPEIAFWGRQVMLEIPAFAFLTWGCVCFIDYLRTKRPTMLYWAVALLVLGIYTKISIVFMVFVWAGTLLIERGISLFKDKHIWISLLTATVVLIPLIIITIKFGQTNILSVTGIPDNVVERTSIDGWIWYLKQIPMQIGWPVSITAALGFVIAITYRQHLTGIKSVFNKNEFWFWVIWAVVGYLYFSAIDLKEARHSVYILPPVVMAASLLFLFLEAKGFLKIANSLWILLPLTVIVHTFFFRPVFYVQGYASAADYIAKHAPHNSNVLFSGYRDGSFIFNIRSLEDRPDIGIIRADKLLLKLAVNRERGVIQKDLSEHELIQQINKLGVHYVVAQSGFWTDLEAMQRFEKLLASQQFQKVAQFETLANFNAQDKQLVIYKNMGPVSSEKNNIEIELPMIGRTINAIK